MKADSVFAILSAKIKKVDGSQAQHYSELAEEAARNAAADAAHIQEASAAIDALEETVGDENSGLVKDVGDLETTVGDANSGLVKDVDDLKTTVGDANSGLVKDVSDAQGDITELQDNELDVEYASDTLTLRKNGEVPTYVFDSSKFIDGTGKSPVAYGYLSNHSFDKNTSSIYIDNQRDDSLYFIGSAYKSGSITYIVMIEYSPTATFSLSSSNVRWGWYGGNVELRGGSYTDVGNYRVYIAGITDRYATTILFETYGVGPNIPMLNISDTSDIVDALALEVGLHKDPVSSIRVDSGYYEVVDQSARDQVAVNTTNIQTLGAAVGDAESGLVKDVDDLKTTVGDAESGLVKEVDDLGTQVATNVTNIQTVSNAVDDIYDILSAGGAKYTETVLWSGSQNLTGTMTLSDSVSNYNLIMIVWSPHATDTNIYKIQSFLAVSEITDYSSAYQFELSGIRGLDGSNSAPTNTTAFVSYHFLSPTEMSIDEVGWGQLAKVTILKVVGIKWEIQETALIFSEEEREIGVWTDGKPLYQKSVSFTPTGDAFTIVHYAHGVANIDRVTSFDGNMFFTSGTTQKIPCVQFTSSKVQEGTGAFVQVDKTNIAYMFGTDRSSTTCQVTFRYTKTTDVAGSGVRTTTGGYAHHYSTTEHVVGTWIDGSTIYEKTFVYNNIRIGNGGPNLPIDVSIQMLLNVEGLMYATGSGASMPFPITSNSGVCGLRLTQNGNSYLTQNGTDSWEAGTDRYLYLTLQYTKTTD